MPSKMAAFDLKWSRRTILGATAAIATSPAVAADCHIGPPPHAKGPNVFLDLDQVELDAAYDQAFYAPLRLQVINRYAAASELARVQLGQPQRVAYGPSEAEKLDIYRAKRSNSPIFVYIHGGAWLGGEAKNNAFAAEMFVNSGANFISLDFIAIKDAGGDLRVMAEQVRRAIAGPTKTPGALEAIQIASTSADFPRVDISVASHS